MNYSSGNLTISRSWKVPCGFNVKVGNGDRKVFTLRPDGDCIELLGQLDSDDDNIKWPFISDTSYPTHVSSTLLASIEEFVAMFDQACYNKVPDLEPGFSVMNPPVKKENYIGITYNSLISGDPALATKFDELEFLATKAVGYAYSQTYMILANGDIMIPDHIKYLYDSFAQEDIPHIVGVIGGKLHIFGRQTNADQSLIDNFSPEIAIQILRQFYYHLTANISYCKSARSSIIN